MTLPFEPSKRFYKAALKQAGPDWGVAVAVAAGDEILATSDGNPALKQVYESYAALGRVMPKDGDLSEQGAIDFPPEFDFQYMPGAIGSGIAGLFGTDYIPQPLFVVDATNNKVDFKEGGSELTGTVTSGSYTGATLATAIAAAMNGAPGKALTYTCTYAAATGKFTIGAGTSFTICWNTGTHKATDISTMCGYSDAADDTGLSSYVADTVALGVAYVHTFDWANVASDIFTFLTMRPGGIWEIPTCVPMKLSLKVGKGKLQGSLQLRGNTLKNDSTTNTETETSVLTPESEGDFVKAQESTVRMNAEAGDALDSGDALLPSDFNSEIERIMDAQMVLGGTYISRPAESNFKIGVKLALPRAGAADVAYLTTFKAMTAQKLEVAFTGPVIAGTHAYKLTVGFPRLKFAGPPDVKLEDIIKNGLEFIAEEAASAPQGMGTHVRPYIELINTRATAYVS